MNTKPLQCIHKRVYPTRMDATIALLKVKDNGTKKIPREVYHCEFCRQWHLTSRISKRK